jgi:hypothetical protein
VKEVFVMNEECWLDSSFDPEDIGATNFQGKTWEGDTMRTNLIITCTVLAVSFLVSIGISALPTQAADKPLAVPVASPSAGERAIVASGAAEDTLRACLARIPKDASAGQRIMAEQSCKRDEGTRETVNAVPGR